MILIGRAASNGSVAVFCIDDHHWSMGSRAEALRQMHIHWTQFHRGLPFNPVEAPEEIPWRPTPVDRGSLGPAV